MELKPSIPILLVICVSGIVTSVNGSSCRYEVEVGQPHCSAVGYAYCQNSACSGSRPYKPPKTSFQSREGVNIATKCAPPVNCNVNSRYRTIDGSCNNKEQRAAFGQANTALIRLLPADYNDGEREPRKMSDGRPLPSARLLRTLLFPVDNCPSHINTEILVFWGQAIAHDTSHIDFIGPIDALQDANCCLDGKGQGLNGATVGKSPPKMPPFCLNIDVPHNDAFYSQYNVTCIGMLAARTTNTLGCPIKPLQPVSSVTHFLDCSFIYGSDNDLAKQLRSFTGGKLKTTTAADQSFPPKLDDGRDSCNVPSASDICYLAGDNRVNQNPGIAILTILFLREHNRLCESLAKINPYWDDETLYQEARRILIAEFHHITYTDFISALLGAEYVKDVGLYPKHGFQETYDPTVNPNTYVEMSGGAYRALHAMIRNDILSSSQEGCPFRKIKLANAFNNPQFLQGKQFSNYVYGLEFLSAKEMDMRYPKSMADEFERSNGTEYGTDVTSIDIQRGRQLGIPPYVKMREACGFPKINSFYDLIGIMKPEDIEKLKTVYTDAKDIDYIVGGNLEIRMPGSLVGPTFQCVMFTQFFNWRWGDRYFYNLKNQDGSFEKDQLYQIQKASLARLICDNIKGTYRVLRDPFYRFSKRNPLINCRDVPKVDLNYWRARYY
ncbi:peroxidase [Nilaparvata lugens]|uniref:peroxidase n=1 Tax=Nilaparvata lugens TaxID=108931 RepID=UPI000B98D7BF|nr:peroxidase [Nilaparvata lugens]